MTKRKKYSAIFSFVFLIVGIFFIKSTVLKTEVRVIFECYSKGNTYVETHYKSQEKKIKRYQLNKEGKLWENAVFYINYNKYGELYFYLGNDSENKKENKKIYLRKITVKGIFKSIDIGLNVFYRDIENKESGKVRRKNKYISFDTPFTLINKRLNKYIGKISNDKTFYYVLLTVVSFLIYFFLISFKLPDFFKIKNPFIIIFFILIITTSALNLIKILDCHLIEEVKFRVSDLQGTYKKFSDYFSKSFYNRNLQIKTFNTIKINLFGISPIDKVIIGKNKWLFYAKENENTDVIEYFRAIKPFAKEELEYWKEKLEERYYWLKKRGIIYIFIIIPNKSSIYPEFLPDYIHKAKGKNRLDQLIDYLKKKKSPVKILDIRDELFKQKTKYKVYQKTDSHWSDYGAFFGYKEIMRTIESRYGIKTRTLNLSDCKVGYKKNYMGGDLAKLLLMQDKLREDRTFIVKKIKTEIIDKKLKGFKMPFVDISVKENKKGKLGTLIFVHDSFGYKLKPFLPQHFKRIIFLRDWELHFYNDLIEKDKPIIVIEEMAERFLMSKVLKNPYDIKK